MPTRLYLDTARLGLMSRSAQQIQTDFARFVGEEAGSLYLDEFIKCGAQRWPIRLRRRFPALAAWQGLSRFKSDLRRLGGVPPDWKVILAQRSAQLMKLAARLLAGKCQRVLITDLTWPSYRRILLQECAKAGCSVTTLPIRHRILKRRCTVADLGDQFAEACVEQRCNGLFLPAVDNLGIRLPTERIVRVVRRQTKLRFVAVDAAQALCHIPLHLYEQSCDFLIAGCHKWLRAYYPMGMAFYGRPGSLDYVERMLGRLQNQRIVDDPLLRFLTELEGDCSEPYGETVNLTPLFSCHGAVIDARDRHVTTDLGCRQKNANCLLRPAAECGWQPLVPTDGFRSGILLLQSNSRGIRRMAPETLRRQFQEHGMAVTTYSGGIVRLSIPSETWGPSRIGWIADSLRQVASGQQKLSSTARILPPN